MSRLEASSRPAGRRRVIAGALIVLLVAVGLGVHFWAADSAASDVAGDALYAATAYVLVVFLVPRWSVPATGGVAAAWCVAVELFQLTGLPLAWGAVFPPIMLVLGAVFDARDIVVYVVTIVVCAAGDAAVRAIRRR